MNNLLLIIDNVEFERISGAEWYIIVNDMVCGQIYAEHYDMNGYAEELDNMDGLNTEDLTWTINNYVNEYKYIEPTKEELKEAILKAI